MFAKEKIYRLNIIRRVLTVLMIVLAIAILLPTPLVAAVGEDTAAGGLALLAKERGAPLTFGDFTGSNSFFNENQSTYEIFGNIREYHPWGFTEWTAGWYEDGAGLTSESIKSMNPTATFMNTWGSFDNYYKTMFEKGIEVTICMTGTVDSRPRPDYQDADGTKSAVPASYLGHAQSMFQLVARYGSNTDIDPALVRVALGTEKKIGLGYVRYFENCNEPNLNGFNGAQFAAMLSADYDGHMGTMGPGVGVKTADPQAKMVLGGLAGVMFNTTVHKNTDNEDNKFIEDMLAWFDANRTLKQWKAAHGGSEAGYEKYPFDVISCHSYSTNEWAGYGLSVEANHYFEIISAYVNNCHELFPGKEVYLSEFGWDTAAGGYSPFRVYTDSMVNTGLSGPEIQGRWLVREYLILAAAGIDGARQFMIPDTSADPNNPDWFATCGLVYGIQGSTNFKPAWYYIGTMNNVLKDASLKDLQIVADGGFSASGGGVNATETAGPWALKFSSTHNTDQIFALWLPTSLGDLGGANVQNYTAPVPAGYKHATLITLKDKVKWGERIDISDRITANAITVSISEKPVFLVLSEEEYYNPIYDYIHPHSFDTWTLTPDSGDPSLLFDEQRVSLSAPPPNMANSWRPEGVHRYAVIDMGAKYNLSNMYIWDRDGALAAGKVLAVYAYSGASSPDLAPNSMSGAQVQAMLAGHDWRRIAWYDFAGWDTWAEAVVSAETRYLVLGFEDGPSEFYDNPWPVDWLPVTELVIKGALAKGETPPQPPPSPPPLVFEPKPSQREFSFLFDNDFADGLIKGSVNGGTFTVVTGKNAYGNEGKFLKVETDIAKPEFIIPTAALASMEYDRWYYIDYKFLVESEDRAPELYLRPYPGQDGSYVYSSVGGNMFKPFWSFDSDIIAVHPNQWHHIKARIMVDSKDKYLSYEVFYDGARLSYRNGIFPQTLPLNGLSLYMTASPYLGGGVYYYDDIWVYTRTPGDDILTATFDKLPVGRLLKHGDDGLGMRDIYSGPSVVIQPAPSDPFYVGAADHILKTTAREWLFDTTFADTLQEIKVGEDYVFELSFFYEDAHDNLTKTPSLFFLYNDWMLHSFAATDWYGGIWVREQDWRSDQGWEEQAAVRIRPTGDQWHRYVVKYRFDTASKITYSFYYDDISQPLTTVTLDAAVEGEMDNRFDNLVNTMGFMVGAEGFDLDKYPMYLNDVLIYKGDIRPWPAKYRGETITCSGQVLYQPSPRPAKVELFDSAGTPIAFTDTDEDGAYTLSVTAGAGYTLVITKPAYLSYTIKNLTLTEGETIDMRQMGGDINEDGYINSEDLVCLISEYGRAPVNYPLADIDGDGLVNSVDLTCLLAGYGRWNVVVE